MLIANDRSGLPILYRSFMEAISSGNYSADLDEEVSVGRWEIPLFPCVTSLRQMRKKIVNEIGQHQGLAQIGELLRTSFTTTQELFDNIIKFVVKYTKSNQGGLFLLNEENRNQKHLDLVACYAYERKKFLNKSIDIGEGLVGQSFLEAQSIYLVEVPNDYIAITSSLGGAKPNALLFMPLKSMAKFSVFLSWQLLANMSHMKLSWLKNLRKVLRPPFRRYG